jgi:hypothetical protein
MGGYGLYETAGIRKERLKNSVGHKISRCGLSGAEKPDINGLTSYEYLDKLPEEALVVRRRSVYDKPISDAKSGKVVRLSFLNEKIATSRYLALTQRLKTDKTLAVRRSGKDIYIFPRKMLERK